MCATEEECDWLVIDAKQRNWWVEGRRHFPHFNPTVTSVWSPLCLIIPFNKVSKAAALIGRAAFTEDTWKVGLSCEIPVTTGVGWTRSLFAPWLLFIRTSAPADFTRLNLRISAALRVHSERIFNVKKTRGRFEKPDGWRWSSMRGEAAGRRCTCWRDYMEAELCLIKLVSIQTAHSHLLHWHGLANF